MDTHPVSIAGIFSYALSLILLSCIKPLIRVMISMIIDFSSDSTMKNV